MERQLILPRKTVFWLFILAALLWYFWSYLFPKHLDSSDIILMKKSYMGEEKKIGKGIWVHRDHYICIGVKNICKSRPSQYRDFLPKVAAQIADTTHENITIYFLVYDRKIERYVHSWTPYKLEEEVPNAFLLREYWKNGGKEPDYVRWYIPTLQYLNN
jgi:hypothetical protein